MDFVSGVSTAKALLDCKKVIDDLLNRPKIDADAVRSKMAEMFIHVAAANEKLVSAHDQIRDLSEKLAASEKLERTEADLEFVEDGAFYVRKSDQSGGKTIRYCKDCWVVKQQLNPLVTMSSGPGLYKCTVDGHQFETQQYRDYEETTRKAEQERRSAEFPQFRAHRQ